MSFLKKRVGVHLLLLLCLSAFASLASPPLVSAEIVTEQAEVLNAALDELEKCKVAFKDAKVKLSEEIIRLRWMKEQDANERELLLNLSLFEHFYLRVRSLYYSVRSQLEHYAKMDPEDLLQLAKARTEYYAVEALVHFLEVSFGFGAILYEAKVTAQTAFLLRLRSSLPKEYLQYAEQATEILFIGIPAFFLAVIWHTLTNRCQRFFTHMVLGERIATKIDHIIDVNRSPNEDEVIEDDLEEEEVDNVAQRNHRDDEFDDTLDLSVREEFYHQEDEQEEEEQEMDKGKL